MFGIDSAKMGMGLHYLIEDFFFFEIGVGAGVIHAISCPIFISGPGDKSYGFIFWGMWVITP
jgi:hypothetical protein